MESNQRPIQRQTVVLTTQQCHTFVSILVPQTTTRIFILLRHQTKMFIFLKFCWMFEPCSEVWDKPLYCCFPLWRISIPHRSVTYTRIFIPHASWWLQKVFFKFEGVITTFVHSSPPPPSIQVLQGEMSLVHSLSVFFNYSCHEYKC